ncbi:hypothetical protein M9H77_13721 [Catharanthus roseus]|uniref:Uncharacterized protein n=1 Tax=Catharanthus roseus TaxID=4058 RepID=A0ACC0BKZ2_CATRO|nr:hypothetical protein M9H77_13721 [Catharanthus roseus]
MFTTNALSKSPEMPTEWAITSYDTSNPATRSTAAKDNGSRTRSPKLQQLILGSLKESSHISAASTPELKEICNVTVELYRQSSDPKTRSSESRLQIPGAPTRSVMGPTLVSSPSWLSTRRPSHDACNPLTLPNT